MRQTKSAGGIVLNEKGEVLVVSQNGNSWSLPKGHIDPDEDALDAAKREIYEESGITDLALVKGLGSYQRYKICLDGGDDMSELKDITVFLFRTGQNMLRSSDTNIPEARWVKKDKVASLLTHKKDKEFFLSVINEL